MRPFGGLIFATDLIQFAKHDVAEMGRAAILRRTAASTRALALLLLLTPRVFLAAEVVWARPGRTTCCPAGHCHGSAVDRDPMSVGMA